LPPYGFDFNTPTALKGWVGQAAKRTGALHIIIILTLLFDFIRGKVKKNIPP